MQVRHDLGQAGDGLGSRGPAGASLKDDERDLGLLGQRSDVQASPAGQVHQDPAHPFPVVFLGGETGVAPLAGGYAGGSLQGSLAGHTRIVA